VGDDVAIGMAIRGNCGLGVGFGVDVSFGLAVGSVDGVAVTVVVGFGVGLDAAVVGSTSRSAPVPESESVPESVAHLPKDAGR